MYLYKDYKDFYGRIMQFGKNKKVPIHRWYPFVEGYSKEFIESIIDEQDSKPDTCLEPFSGSGTTSLELQKMGICCISFEVNPFMYALSKAKLKSPQYNSKVIKRHVSKLRSFIDNIDDESIELDCEFSTLVESIGKNKWNLNKDVYLAIRKLQMGVDSLNSYKYSDLYKIVIANALLEFGNLYRNGKCLSYKKNWKDKEFKQKEIFEYFYLFIKEKIISDIELCDDSYIDNSNHLFLGDSRKLLEEKLKNDSIDLVITSPPYLNSRDYTDSYMLELKALGYTKTHNEIKKLRKETLRSHVQIKIEDNFHLCNNKLDNTIAKLTFAKDSVPSWNDEIILMVKSYFDDMELIFKAIYKKLKKEKLVYFNVSNSAYYGVLIDTLEICASIAESIGFTVIEIREARYLNPSPQQRNVIDKLLEGVIVLKKTEGGKLK